MSVEIVNETRECPMCGAASPLTVKICDSCGERLVTRPGDLPGHDQFRRYLNGIVGLWLVTGAVCVWFGVAMLHRTDDVRSLESYLAVLSMAWGAAFLLAGWRTARRSTVAVWFAIGLSMPVFFVTLLSVVLIPGGLVLFFGMLRAHRLAEWLRLAKSAGIAL